MYRPEIKLARKNLLLKAKLAEEAKRYDHMLLFVRQIIEITGPYTELTKKERCLLDAAFRNFIAQPRESLRTATATTGSWTDPFRGPIASSYLSKSKKEIRELCAELIDLIDNRLLPFTDSKDSKVFYLTLKGDFIWYSAEFKEKKERMADVAAAQYVYKNALMYSKNLDMMNPNRLALEFSLAEFYFECLNSPLNACFHIDRAVNIAPLANPETTPKVSPLTFEGGVQLLGDLINLKRKLTNVLLSKVTGPSNVPAGLAGPSNVPAADVAGLSNVPAGNVAVPSDVSAGNVAKPSHVQASDIAGPSNVLTGYVAGPSNVLAGYVAGPSNVPASDVAGPSNVLAGYVAGPSNVPASYVVGPSNVPTADLAENRPSVLHQDDHRH